MKLKKYSLDAKFAKLWRGAKFLSPNLYVTLLLLISVTTVKFSSPTLIYCGFNYQ
jgi:hypothetical protein